MDALQTFVLQLFSKLRPDPVASLVFGIGLCFAPYMLQYLNYPVPGAGFIIFVGILLLLSSGDYAIKFCITWRRNRNAVYTALQSLSPEEKAILRDMLVQNINNYEIEIHNNFDENAQTHESIIFSRMRALKDKGLLDLTQVQYTKNSDMMKGSMPIIAWNIACKEYKRDNLFLARRKKKIGRVKKILRRTSHKKKKR